MSNKTFDYGSIPLGFYDEIAKEKKGMRSFWHNNKFNRIVECFSENSGALLDVGCFAGTFLGMVDAKYFERQVGIDILGEQIEYAKKNYGSDFREFIHFNNFDDMNIRQLNSYDVVTCIEVIEHLTFEQINQLFRYVDQVLKKEGAFYLTTPNYFSHWPLLEVILNLLSKVKYEDQHLTKFTYLNFDLKIKKIVKDFESKFDIEFVTTINFLTPFMAVVSYPFARWLAKVFKHKKWRNPFGTLLMIKLVKK